MSDAFKKAAGEAAAALVETETVIGLGTGSTAAFFIEALGRRLRDGLRVAGIPTSEATRKLALAAGVDIIEPDETTKIALAIDGADEIGPRLSLIKGGGGALLREKIIAEAAERFVVIADDTKVVASLGAFPLPIEIIPFGWAITVGRIRRIFNDLGFDAPKIDLRAAAPSKQFETDGGNWIVDCHLGRIDDPYDLDQALRQLPGVVETGLFVRMADLAIVAGPDGLRRIEP
ncbi:MAG: ribose-5-phosphate isomerase RpiA [Pseudomonadota bacterium]